MKFEVGDRVEVLPSANDPAAFDPYCARGAPDAAHRRGLVAGDRGTVVILHSGMLDAKFDRIPGLCAIIRHEHLKKLDPLYGNEEE